MTMAKLAGPLMGLKDTDEVGNQRVAKSGIVLSSLKLTIANKLAFKYHSLHVISGVISE